MNRAIESPRWKLLAAMAAIGVAVAASAVAQSKVSTLFAFEESVAGDEELKLRWPTAVAAGGIDEIAVADSAGPSLLVFRDAGGGEGWVVHHSIELPAPAYDVSCGGEQYIVSTRRQGVLLAVSKVDYTLSERPLPPGVTPGAVTCLADEQLLVHDLAAGRLMVLDRGGKIVASVDMPDAVAALAPGPGGGFYAALPGVAQIRRYGANGAQLSVLPVPGLASAPAWPVGLIVESNGEVVVVDRHAGRIVVLDASGRWIGSGARRGWEPGLLRFPSGIAELPDGTIVIADQGNGRIQFFRRLEP